MKSQFSRLSAVVNSAITKQLAVIVLLAASLPSMSIAQPSAASARPSASSALGEVMNYREYTSDFASAGQPTREQFSAIKDSGYERVINIAFSNIGTGIPEEDQIVKGLGMDYLQIPVDFANPTIRDFNAFADAMRREPEMKTLLHCQVNARATAFSFLYRVIYQDAPVSIAKASMNSVWQPNAVWRDFIFEVLEANGKSHDCDDCDWTPPPPRQQ